MASHHQGPGGLLLAVLAAVLLAGSSYAAGKESNIVSSAGAAQLWAGLGDVDASTGDAPHLWLPAAAALPCACVRACVRKRKRASALRFAPSHGLPAAALLPASPSTPRKQPQSTTQTSHASRTPRPSARTWARARGASPPA